MKKNLKGKKNLVEDEKKVGFMSSKVGVWSFAIGLILAVVLAIIGSDAAWAVLVLGLLGIIAGVLNVSDKEVNTFLIAAIAFLLSANALSDVFTRVALDWPAVGKFFGLLGVFFAPAAAIVAVKALYSIARD